MSLLMQGMVWAQGCLFFGLWLEVWTCEWQSYERWILKIRILVGLEVCFCHLMENQKQRSTEDLFVWFCGPFLCFVLYVHACESWWLISDSELKGGTAFCRRIFLTILQLCCTDCIEKSSPPIKESVFSYGEMGTMACTPHITKCLSCEFEGNVHAEWSLCICIMVLAPVQSQVW
jgi:hypothetical protein